MPSPRKATRAIGNVGNMMETRRGAPHGVNGIGAKLVNDHLKDAGCAAWTALIFSSLPVPAAIVLSRKRC